MNDDGMFLDALILGQTILNPRKRVCFFACWLAGWQERSQERGAEIPGVKRSRQLSDL